MLNLISKEDIMIHTHLSDLEICWLHGFKAFHQKAEETTNPYTKVTKQAHYWREGWWEAFYNTENLSDVYVQHYNQSTVESLAS